MNDPATEPRYELLHLDQVDPVDCPCGKSRRAFVNDADRVGSLHVVDSDGAAQTHYHKRTTEIYYILEGTGRMELDGATYDIGPGNSILIKPECRHRAIGKLRFINVSIPAFDPHDEWFDD